MCTKYTITITTTAQPSFNHTIPPPQLNITILNTIITTTTLTPQTDPISQHSSLTIAITHQDSHEEELMRDNPSVCPHTYTHARTHTHATRGSDAFLCVCVCVCVCRGAIFHLVSEERGEARFEVVCHVSESNLSSPAAHANYIKTTTELQVIFHLKLHTHTNPVNIFESKQEFLLFFTGFTRLPPVSIR